MLYYTPPFPGECSKVMDIKFPLVIIPHERMKSQEVAWA